LQHAVELELAQCFAHMAATDAETLREFALCGKPVASLQRAIGNQIPGLTHYQIGRLSDLDGAELGDDRRGSGHKVEIG
jgi:hypothetical protein